MKKVKLLLTYFVLAGCGGMNHSGSSLLINDTLFKTNIPKAGRLMNDKPAGSGWINLIGSLDDWNLEQQNWKLDSDILHGDYNGGKLHSYGYTKTKYTNFELNVLLRMTGTDANSGVCIRINPTDFDNAPGYQIDMGPGYWGCLWEERRDGMVQKFPIALANKLVKENDWNHYYIIARDHHIQAWLNGVKTIDTTHVKGFSEGAIGLQLCHGNKHTVIDVKTFSLRVLK
jgi:hypothetical protein